MSKKQMGPEGLWDSNDSMERSATISLHGLLGKFEDLFRKCYEAGVQAPTLPCKRNKGRDISISALFLKRVLVDLRGIWLLMRVGYTSPASAVGASLFEHALSVINIAGSPAKAQDVIQSPAGDVPWTPLELCKNLALKYWDEAKREGKKFDEKDFEDQFGYAYAHYKYLCKIKHPTLRSTYHDSKSTQTAPDGYVVMATPNLREEDQPLKAMVLALSLSYCVKAIRAYADALECDKSDAYYISFEKRLEDVQSSILNTAKDIIKEDAPLPFTISDEARKWFKKRGKREKTRSKRAGKKRR